MDTPRTPGIRFEPVPAPPPEPLPRLDVAAFVGFAANGPVDVPVAVEDVVRFHELFGQDLALAWDADRGEIVYALLPSAVRAFFRNGGRRAWIVRVAGDVAESNAFVLPGLLRLGIAGVAGVRAIARSPGAWSDSLGAGTLLLQQPIVPGALTRLGAGTWQFATRRAGATVRAGDLVQLTFAGGVIAYLSVETVVRPSGTSEATLRGREAGFRAASLDAIWPSAPGQPMPAVSLLDGDQDVPLVVQPWRPPVQSLPAAARAGFLVDRARAADLHPGAWIRLRYPAAAASPPHADLLLQIDQVDGAPVLPASPPPAGDTFLITASQGWWVGLPGGVMPASPPLAAAIVAFEIAARDGSGGIRRMPDLGFTPPHPRWWANLPDDVTLFAPVERPRANPAEALWREASEPTRFPLAAGAPGDGTWFDVPLGVPALPRADFVQPPSHSRRRADERNGLAGFDAALFLDPRLSTSTASTLESDAFAVRYQGSAPGALRRSHVLLDLPEATLVSVPDAAHQLWERRAEPQTLVDAPVLAIGPPDVAGLYDVTWSATLHAQYILQESPDPRFESAMNTRTTAAAARRGPVPGCQRLFYRVRAITADGTGPWSNTVEARRPGAAFAPCPPAATGSLEPPVLTLSGPFRGLYTLAWTGAATGRAFTLHVSADPTFAASRPLYEGPLTRFSVWATNELAYFRVAAVQAGEPGPWSRTIWDRSRVPLRGSGGRGSLSALAPADLPTVTPGQPPLDDPAASRLLDVHRALVRICFARGDLLAVLTLPAGARADRALAYRTSLLDALEGDDERMPSYVALFHPWVVLGEQPDGALRTSTPDGSAAGVIARRAFAAGGWTSPANQTWTGVLGLDPVLTLAERDALRAARLNVLSEEARGFATLSADTLHTDPDSGEINLRLLAFLLRRLALRDGMGFAFQSNDAALRRLIEREFDRVMGDLYMRGAFAGLTRAAAYRIVTDDSVNTRQSIEAGRCVVELRYAPSRPMAFLTVRLVQRGSGVVLAEEAAGG